MLVHEQCCDSGDAHPVERPDRQAGARRDEERDRRQVQRAGAGERTTLAEPRRPRVQPLFAVDLRVEERIEEIEAGNPGGDAAAERPGLPRQLTLDRGPRAHRRQPVDGAEPEVAEPREPLQVRVDDEGDDGDLPERDCDALRLQRWLDEVVITDRGATGRDQDVGAGIASAADALFGRFCRVSGDAEIDRLGALGAGQRPQRVTVGIDDLAGT